jgi:hypothetical protein
MVKKVRNMPPVGTKLQGKYKGRDYFAEVVEATTFKIGRGILFKGELFSSMSSAASKVRKQPTNGWIFWKFQ